MVDRLVSAKDTAAMLGISRVKLYRLKRAKLLPVLPARQGHTAKTLWRLSEVQSYIKGDACR